MMRPRAKLVCFGGALPTIAVLAHGCKDPTQVTVEISTNVVCTEQRGVDVVAASAPAVAEERAALITAGARRFPSGTTTDCAEGPPPRKVGTLVVTPSGSAGAVVVISAFGNARLEDCVAPQLAPQCIIARRRFSFVENRKLVVPILLDPECAGVPCNATSTCVGKKCVDSFVDCTGDACTQPGVAPDGGVVEVDAAGPLTDGAGPIDDSGLGDAASDSGGDGSSPGDSGPDGAVGSDGSTSGQCPGTACLGGPPAVACLAGDACCYGGGSPSCSSFSLCPTFAACCHGSNACPGGMVCCADTATPQATTHVACKSAQECSQTGGVRVCSSNDMGCNGGFCDTGNPYSADPQFFRCS